MTLSVAVDNTRQYVTLGIDREVFAVDVNQVHEILDVRPISRVPNAPGYMLGMIDVRSRTVPVIDLRVRLGFPAAEPTPNTRIVVLDVTIDGRDMAMGLMADRVYEVTELAEHSLEPPPEIGIRWNSDYIKGVGRHGGAFVIVLDLAHLFGSEDGALIAGLRHE
ncbi:MAG: chemotaxis protein CheW [Bacteroidota bacterium]